MAEAEPKPKTRTTTDGRVLYDGPSEPQLTGPVMRAIAGARSGKQVQNLDMLGIGWGSYTSPKGRAWGRESGVLGVIKAIRDLDAMASDAVWVWLRLLNAGCRLVALQNDTTEDEVDEQAQLYLDDLATWVGKEYGGGLDQVLNVMGLQALTFGAIALEVTPNEGLNGVEDWYPIDPTLISFRRDPDSLALVMGQVDVEGRWEPLPPEQVFYVPIDPDVDDPYGRPPFLAAVQSIVARAQIQSDMRAYAHQAGFPRIDVKVVWSIVQEAAPPQLREPGREADFQAWAEKQLNRLVTDYTALNIDDTFVHYDWVEPKLMEASALSFDFPALDTVLQRQVNAGLKTLPILLGVNDSTTESHGSVQWQIFAAGVQAVGRIEKRVIEKAANVSLQLVGFNAHARLDREEVRTVDRLYEAQAELFEAQNLKLDVQMGWRDNDEAAQIRTSGEHGAVSEPGAQTAGLQPTPPADGGNPTGDDGTQAPTDAEKAASYDPSWDLLWRSVEEYSARNNRQTAIEVDAGLSGAELHELSLKYAAAAEAIFQQQFQILVQTLILEEGWELPATSPVEQVAAWAAFSMRATSRELADSAFGLGYRREMKKLLRQSVLDGMIRAGDPAPKVDEKIVRKIWKDNAQFVDKLRNDLASQTRAWSDAVRRGETVSMRDVEGWFKDNAYREALMGQFVSKQGLAAGYTAADSAATGKTVFRWDLGPVTTEHCHSCLERAGGTFTHEQLMRIGMPGSIDLACASNCRCSLTNVGCSKDSMERTPKRVLEPVGQDQYAACAVLGAEQDEERAFADKASDVHLIYDRIDTPEPTEEIRTAANAYAGSGVSFDLNSGLRGTEPKYLEQHAATLAGMDKAMGTVKKPIALTRWTNEDVFEGGRVGRPEDLIGQTLTDKGFGSTTATQATSAFNYRAVQWNITAPPGAKATVIDRYATKRETEVVLARGSVYRIDAAYISGSKIQIRATIVGVAK